MKTTIKHYLNHVIRTLNGERKREEISKLQREIEKVTLECEMHKIDDSYIYRINHLSALQYRHMTLTDKYHPVGVYAKMRRDEE